MPSPFWFNLRIDDRRVGLVGIEPRQGDLAPRSAAALGAAEQRYAETLGNARRQREFIQGRVLLRQLLSRAVGHSITGIEITAGMGPPTIIEARGAAGGLCLSLSHAPGWIAGMVSTCAAGAMDLEQERPGRDGTRVARFLGWDKRLRGAGPDAFWRLWTLWEATTKARGGSVMQRRNPLFEELADDFLDRGWATRDAHFAVGGELATLIDLNPRRADLSAPPTHLCIMLDAGTAPPERSRCRLGIEPCEAKISPLKAGI